MYVYAFADCHTLMTPAIPSYDLNNGLKMPALGLGTYRVAEGGEATEAVRLALGEGYRLYDTASLYGNETSVGRAIRDSGVPRSEVFVTTKLWNSDHGYHGALEAFHRSKERLRLGAVDLYLIHWPVERKRLESWRAMEELVEAEETKSIGVSNYLVHHLEELLENGTVVPAVNQIELHPYNYLSRKDTVEFCRARGIQVEAYSPLTKGGRLGDRRLFRIADACRKTPAQVLLRWGIQHGFVVIPKALRPEHIRENAAIFDFVLSREQMRDLDSLDESLATGWDPTGKP